MHFILRTKYYFTDKFDTEIINNTDKNTIIIYRNYIKKINIGEIIKLKNFCKKKGKKIYLSNNVRLALKLRLDGAYIPSYNKTFNHLAFSFKKKFDLIGSAHSLKEIRIKEKQKVNKIFVSSLFKKNKNYLGINKIKIISNYTKKKIVLLGGISNKNIRKLNLLNASDFAGISFFEQKKGP